MALKVGDLYVSLTANTQKLQGQLNGAAKTIEKFGRQLKGLGKDASDMSNMVTAAVAAAVAVASSKDATVKKQVEELKNQSTALAVEIARVALPVLQSMADFVGRVVALFRSLTPEQRAMVLTFLEAAAAVSAVGMAAVKLEPAFKLAASGVRLLATMVGAFSLPAIGAIAGVILVVGFLREAWDENLGGIQDKAAAVWGWIQEKWTTVANTLSGASDTVKVKFAEAFKWIGEKFSEMAQWVIRGTANLARALELDSVFDVDGMEKAALNFTDNLPKMLLEGAATLKDGAVAGVGMIVGGVGTALSMSGKGVVKIASDVKAKLDGLLGGILPQAAKATEFKDLTDKADKVQTDYGRLRADKMDASFVALRGRGGNLRDSLEMAGALNVPKELEQFTGDALASIKGIEDVRDFLHRLGAKGGEAEKYLAAWEKWNEEQKKAAQHVDRLRADRIPGAAQAFLGGGTLGDAARMAGITSGIPPAFEEFSGGLLRTASDFEDLRDRLAQVREKNPLIDQFIDQMQAVQEDAARKAKELEEARKQAIDGFKDGVVGSIGKLGGIIQAATGPMAQAAGPIGMLIAVVFELVKDSAGFQLLVESLNGILQSLGDALGQLLTPFADLINSLTPAVSAIAGMVAPLVPLIEQILAPLLPVFVVLGTLLQALTPVVQLVANYLSLAIIPALWFLEKILQGLFATMQMVSIAILGIVIGVLKVWNGVVGALQSVFAAISSFEIAGQRPLAFLDDWAAGLESAKMSTAGYEKQLSDAASLTWDSAMVTAKSFGGAAEAADQLAAGMTNAASGFKVDLARYNAANVGASPGSPADLGSSGSALTGDTYVTIVSNDPEAIWEKMDAIKRRRAFQAGRGPLGGMPIFGA